jgi:hypothetical protein
MEVVQMGTSVSTIVCKNVCNSGANPGVRVHLSFIYSQMYVSISGLP